MNRNRSDIRNAFAAPERNPGARRAKRSRLGAALAASAAALAAAAVYNAYRAREAERGHPPAGRFVTVDGVRLHYLEWGEGPPVVLLHGNVVTADDFELSGIPRLLAGRHRVVAFDRPGFGYSDRPKGKAWTAARQAGLLRRAFARLGIERPVVAGHSWGTLVALELALRYPDAVDGLVLLGGYYHPTMRADVPLFSPPAIPVIGTVLCHTVSPLLGTAMLPLAFKAMFSPRPVPERFARDFPRGLSVRPSQVRAEAQDTATMIPAAAALRHRFGELRMPVTIMAGTADRVVDVEAHAARLHDEIPHSVLRLVAGAGHMVHHAAPEQVAEAVEAVFDRARSARGRRQVPA